MKTLLNRKNESGFTLIEMVVAVGVLLALSVGGFLAYSGHQHRAKVAVTEAAAQEVYNGGRLAQEQGQAATTARDEFNATTDAITTDIEEKSDRTICATAVHQDDNEITASRGNCSGESGNTVKPPTNENNSNLTATCKQGSAAEIIFNWDYTGEPKEFIMTLTSSNGETRIQRVASESRSYVMNERSGLGSFIFSLDELLGSGEKATVSVSTDGSDRVSFNVEAKAGLLGLNKTLTCA